MNISDTVCSIHANDTCVANNTAGRASQLISTSHKLSLYTYHFNQRHI
jgi:hypothetical protein